MLKFVKAQFPNSQKHYDYICEIEDIKKGDKVFVMTRYGKKLVTVRGIFYSELEDMPLPAYAYKKVLGKYDSVFVDDWDNEYVYDEPYSSKENVADINSWVCGTPYLKENVKQQPKIYKIEVNRRQLSKPSQNTEVKKRQDESSLSGCLIYLLFFITLVVFLWSIFTEEGQQARALLREINEFAPRR